MGLTIHYDLKSPARIRKSEKILALVESLHQRAMDLPFESCDDVIHLVGKDCEYSDCEYSHTDSETRKWLKIQACQYVVTGHDVKQHYGVTPCEIIAFECWPGVGCEAMNIGLCRYPKTISIDGKTYPTRLGGWRWGSFCKTQYASNIGVRHFLHCHNLVCVLLDAAKELGFRVDVDDEGKFYQNRNFDVLAKEVGQWNAMIAGFAGKLRDVFGTESIKCPITKHPAYEHLEAQGNAAHGHAARLMTLLSGASLEEIEKHKQFHPEQWEQ